MTRRELEPIDITVSRLVALANGDPHIVERICRDLYEVLGRRFAQPAIDRDDIPAEMLSLRIAAYCDDLANFAEDHAEHFAKTREEKADA